MPDYSCFLILIAVFTIPGIQVFRTAVSYPLRKIRRSSILGHHYFQSQFFLDNLETRSSPLYQTYRDIQDNFNDSLTMNKVLFVESGFGCDQHGQNSTKAAVRACRNAIEFNSLPSLQDIIPGGKDNMVLRIQIAVPAPETVDLLAVAAVFPYGQLIRPEITLGGMCASSGIALPELGDKNDDMIIAVAVVSVGY